MRNEKVIEMDIGKILIIIAFTGALLLGTFGGEYIKMALAFVVGNESNDRTSTTTITTTITLLLLSAILIVILALGVGFIHLDGKGNLTNTKIKPLSNGATYKTLCSVSQRNGVAVLLQKQNGELLAYELKEAPPPIFIKTDNDSHPYVPIQEQIQKPQPQ